MISLADPRSRLGRLRVGITRAKTSNPSATGDLEYFHVEWQTSSSGNLYPFARPCARKRRGQPLGKGGRKLSCSKRFFDATRRQVKAWSYSRFVLGSPECSRRNASPGKETHGENFDPKCFYAETGCTFAKRARRNAASEHSDGCWSNRSVGAGLDWLNIK